MATLDLRLAEASKEDLLQIVHAVGSAHATTRAHVVSVLDYLDAQKKQASPKKRRSSSRRASTRASSEASQDSAVHLHPLLQQAVKTTAAEHALKICKVCAKAFDEKNAEELCCRHTGHWLIEVEDENTIEFVAASKAPDEIKNDASLLWVMSCCSLSKDDLGEGCTAEKHVAMGTEDKGTASA